MTLKLKIMILSLIAYYVIGFIFLPKTTLFILFFTLLILMTQRRNNIYVKEEYINYKGTKIFPKEIKRALENVTLYLDKDKVNLILIEKTHFKKNPIIDQISSLFICYKYNKISFFYRNEGIGGKEILKNKKYILIPNNYPEKNKIMDFLIKHNIIKEKEGNI